MGNPAEETCCYPNEVQCIEGDGFVNCPFDFSSRCALNDILWVAREECANIFDRDMHQA